MIDYFPYIKKKSLQRVKNKLNYAFSFIKEMPMGENFIETLECILTEAESIERGRELARHLSEKSQLENRKAEFVSQIKADIDKEDSSISRLTSVVNSGKEYRQVKCVFELDWKAQVKKVIRLDTGELVRVMNITPEEQQGQLALDEKASPSGDQDFEVVDDPPATPSKNAEKKEKPEQDQKEDDAVKTCPECKSVFVAESKETLYCSKKCKQAAKNAKRRENRAKKAKKVQIAGRR